MPKPLLVALKAWATSPGEGTGHWCCPQAAVGRVLRRALGAANGGSGEGDTCRVPVMMPLVPQLIDGCVVMHTPAMVGRLSR